MISLLRSIQTVNTRAGLILSVILMLLGSPLALAQCVDATATTQAELESVILDFNGNCGAGDVLTTTVSGTITISGSAFSPVNNGTTAVLEIVGDGDDARRRRVEHRLQLEPAEQQPEVQPPGPELGVARGLPGQLGGVLGPTIKSVRRGLHFTR